MSNMIFVLILYAVGLDVFISLINGHLSFGTYRLKHVYERFAEKKES